MLNRKTTLLALAAAASLALGGAALAQSATAKAQVDAAKANCAVGEQADGFLGFPKPSSDADLKAAVAEINAGRAALYREAAARNGVTPEAAGASAYNTVVQARIKAGECYRPTGGSWQTK